MKPQIASDLLRAIDRSGFGDVLKQLAEYAQEQERNSVPNPADERGEEFDACKWGTYKCVLGELAHAIEDEDETELTLIETERLRKAGLL